MGLNALLPLPQRAGPGRPYQRYSSQRTSTTRGRPGRQPWLEPFGNRRLDNESYLDLRLEKIFKVGAGTDRIAVYADFQNLFNAGTIIAVQRPLPEVSIAGYDEAVAFGDPTDDRRGRGAAPRRPLELLEHRRPVVRPGRLTRPGA